MIEQIKEVEKFHNAFGVQNMYTPNVRDEELASLRHKLMAEENDEYLEAVKNKDLVGIADALGDKLYILCGTILVHGLQDLIIDCFNEIQASNMSKLDENGNAIINGQNGILDESKPLGKVLKSKLYREPDLNKIINP